MEVLNIGEAEKERLCVQTCPAATDGSAATVCVNPLSQRSAETAPPAASYCETASAAEQGQAGKIQQCCQAKRICSAGGEKKQARSRRSQQAGGSRPASAALRKTWADCTFSKGTAAASVEWKAGRVGARRTFLRNRTLLKISASESL